MIRTQSKPVQLEAVSLSQLLADWFQGPKALLLSEVQQLSRQLFDRLESIPPTVADLSTMVVLRNRLRAMSTYLKNGEHGAAKHEAEQLHRKLVRLAW